jgi:hypothetical protein
MMTPRQAKAAAISRALRRDFGVDAQVTSALPLDPGLQLRVQVIDARRNEVVEWLCERGWLPSHICVQWRTATNPYRLIPAAVYEVRIEEERPVIPDRKIYREEVVEERKKTDAEVAAMRRHLGMK